MDAEPGTDKDAEHGRFKLFTATGIVLAVCINCGVPVFWDQNCYSDEHWLHITAHHDGPYRACESRG